MSAALIYTAVSLLSVYALWVFFLAVMNLKSAKDRGTLSRLASIFGTPVLIVGYLLDAFVNIFVLTVLLLDMPEELTVTARFKRYASSDSGWRKRVTTWFARDMLDDFDPSGKHV